jgi:hypothetical protein
MNSLEWLLVLGPVFGVGIYLLIHRLGGVTPVNSIYQGTTDLAQDEEAGANRQRQQSDAQNSRPHGGCCGITR